MVNAFLLLCLLLVFDIHLLFLKPCVTQRIDGVEVEANVVLLVHHVQMIKSVENRWQSHYANLVFNEVHFFLAAHRIRRVKELPVVALKSLKLDSDF